MSDITALVMDTVPVPDDETTPEAPEFSCEVCGKELFYSGRGRHPKRCDEHKTRSGSSSATNISTRKSSAKGDVAQALSALNMMYDLLSMGLLAVGAHGAMDLFGESRAQLNEKNENYLTNDPQLAKSLAKLGKTGGRYAFVTAQVATVGPVVILAAGEVTQRRRDAAAQRDGGDEGRPDGPAFVGGIPVDL